MSAAGWRGRLLFCLAALLPAAGCDDTPPEAPAATLLEAPGDCDPERGCRIEGGDMSLQVRFETPHALKPFRLTLRSSGREAVEAATVTFLMRGMDMGMNRYRLIGASGGVWEGEVTLPVCVSGRSDWMADFELATAKHRYRLQLPFVLHK